MHPATTLQRAAVPACKGLSQSEADSLFFTPANYERAKQEYCSACPLMLLCLETALRNEIGLVMNDDSDLIFGVFGGQDPTGRRNILMRRMITREAGMVPVEQAQSRFVQLAAELQSLVAL